MKQSALQFEETAKAVYPNFRTTFWIYLNDQYVEVLAEKIAGPYDDLEEEEKDEENIIFEDKTHAVYRYKREESGWPKALKDPKELFKALNAIALLTYDKAIVRSWMKSIKNPQPPK